jgi:hypothetical protein
MVGPNGHYSLVFLVTSTKKVTVKTLLNSTEGIGCSSFFAAVHGGKKIDICHNLLCFNYFSNYIFQYDFSGSIHPKMPDMPAWKYTDGGHRRVPNPYNPTPVSCYYDIYKFCHGT